MSCTVTFALRIPAKYQVSSYSRQSCVRCKLLITVQVCIVLYDNTGVPGELYYCRNGVVNDYALSFNLPIKTDITEIYFSWVNAPPLGLQKPDITVSLVLS